MEGLLLLRIDAPLFFANVNPVKEALGRYEARAADAAAARGRPLQFIVIDLSPVTDIDASAVHFLTVRAPPGAAAPRQACLGPRVVVLLLRGVVGSLDGF